MGQRQVKLVRKEMRRFLTDNYNTLKSDISNQINTMSFWSRVRFAIRALRRKI